MIEQLPIKAKPICLLFVAMWKLRICIENTFALTAVYRRRYVCNRHAVEAGRICCATRHHLNWSERFNFHVFIHRIKEGVVPVHCSVSLLCQRTIIIMLFFFADGKKNYRHTTERQRRYKQLPIILMNIVNNFRNPIFFFCSYIAGAHVIVVACHIEACTC